MFSFLLGLIVVVLSFGFIIFVHELGHFLMAKRVGITVHEFALGFGPKIFSREKDGTKYSIGIFPFGGYVAMEGEDSAGESPDDPGNMQNKTAWEKIKVIAAGPVTNYIVAFVLFVFVGLVFGIGQMYLKPKVGTVIENSPAQAIGLQKGDYIVEINGKPVSDALEVIDTIHASYGMEITLKMQRGDDYFTRKVTPVSPAELNPDAAESFTEDGKKIGLIGFQPDQKAMEMRFIPSSPGLVFTDSLDKMYRFTVAPIIAVKLIIDGRMKAREVAEGSAGPVGIGQMFFEMYKKGFPALLYFLAMINVLIGCFNLIPFPALDGSRILILAVSAVIRKPVNQEKEGWVHTVGFFILIALVLVFTFNDISRLIKGGTFF